MKRHRKAPHGAGAANDEATGDLLPQLATMSRALLGSPVRHMLLMLTGGLFVVVIASAYGQIRLNSWNKPFYDALSHHDFPAFLRQLVVFSIITGFLLLLNVGQRWLSETLKLKLREGLVTDLVGHWLQPRRAFRLASAGSIGNNPDQRMHEDARHLTELSADLGTGLLQAGILVVMFIGVLWRISSGFAFHIHGHSYAIPGYMVWAAILYAGSASLLTYWVGRSLIRRNANRYACEADLRSELVKVNEHIDAITLSNGESDEEGHIQRDLKAVLDATRRLVLGLTHLTWITAGYGWFTLAAPILAAAPLYFFGDLSFGGLMMAAGAFTQVQSSLRWFVDNFSQIADWRATLLRVANFRSAVIGADTLHRAHDQIAFANGPAGELRIRKLQIASPAGATQLKEQDVLIRGGDRVLIVGEPGIGKTLLFRALAGLWPWGAGSVIRPGEQEILYVPRTAYWSGGTLRKALAYPRDATDFPDRAYKDALADLDMQPLAALLDKDRGWDKELSDEQLKRLPFARVLLHAPPWVLIDEALDSLDGESRQLVSKALASKLKSSAVIHIGRQTADDSTFRTILHLVRDPKIHRLQHKAARQANHGKAAGRKSAARS